MKVSNKFRLALPIAALITASVIALPGTAMAGHKKHRDYKGSAPYCKVGCKSRWYATGSMGMSRLFDKESAAANSVHENGLGWNVGVGYLYNRYFGGELGYNYYADSRETNGTTQIARTKHYSLYLALTGRYSIGYGLTAFGKIGPGYTYANKLFTSPSGANGSASSLSLFYGVGVAHKLTRKTAALVEWSRVLGNDYTGSADLYSVGLAVML